WGRPETLTDHFERHGGDFGASSEEEYSQQAQEFLVRSQQERLPTRITPRGVIRVYEPSTNTFGSYNADGTTRTFFKPRDGMDYWNNPNNSAGSEPWEAPPAEKGTIRFSETGEPLPEDIDVVDELLIEGDIFPE